MTRVGSITKVDGKYIVDRGWFRQGYIFKDEDAYKNRKDEPCYVPELNADDEDDDIYTGQDFLDMCNGQQEVADRLFEEVDWQHPETLMDEWSRDAELVTCISCGKLVLYGDGSGDTVCPFCGTEVDSERIV